MRRWAVESIHYKTESHQQVVRWPCYKSGHHEKSDQYLCHKRNVNIPTTDTCNSLQKTLIVSYSDYRVDPKNNAAVKMNDYVERPNHCKTLFHCTIIRTGHPVDDPRTAQPDHLQPKSSATLQKDHRKRVL